MDKWTAFDIIHRMAFGTSFAQRHNDRKGINELRQHNRNGATEKQEKT